ncbi:Ig-like domain-containing protein [Bizionia sediminis]|uniref:Ig-like domain-containing protein n=1 Tax=Bizionia sediminis TaxID=1737064 RepID=A0ABW5KRK2_9FLAO
MRKTGFYVIFVLIAGLVISSCANRGTPSGGNKDILPPTITREVPDNYSTNFSGNEIRIYFDEYIKIKNLSKQLIVSPPMDPAPEVTPMSSASKYIKIKIKDTLAPNTTYTFNFGNSIVDNNEENPFSYYTYVFSTGNYIDSLSVKGLIKDATLRAPDNFVSVMLYEVDSMYNDSIIYNKKPKYVTNTLDSTTTFTLQNLKAGTYKLIALKDANQDYQFQPKTDKIAFQEGFITVPVDSAEQFTLKLFSEELEPRVINPRLVSGEKIAFAYEGNYKEMQIQVQSDVPNTFQHRITKDSQADTLYYWYKPRLETDSLLFQVTNNNYKAHFAVPLSEQKRDSMNVQAEPTGTINFTEDFKLTNTVPFTNLDRNKVRILDKDSVAVAFKVTLDSLENRYALKFDKTESNSYAIQILPEALTDFFDATNDTLNYKLTTKKYADYGNVRVILKNATYPVIAQITDNKGVVVAEAYSRNPEPIDFRHLKTGEFYLRVVYDTNENKKYDTGNFLKNQQPERISYYKEKLDIRANFEMIYEFTLF